MNYNISASTDIRYAQRFQIVDANPTTPPTLPANSPYKWGKELTLDQIDGNKVMVEFPKNLKTW